MTEHTWFQDNLAAHLAGGLSTEEAERFGRHRVACGACAKLLADAQSFDGAMESLFAPVRPEVGWENRVIDNLRAAPRWRRRRWSAWARVAMSAAAVVVLGVMGAVLHGVVGKGSLVFPGSLGELRMAQPVKDDRSYFAALAADKAAAAHKRVTGLIHQSGQGWGEWSQALGVGTNVSGKININTVHAPELLEALVDNESKVTRFSEEQVKARSAGESAKEDKQWNRFDTNGDLAKQVADLADGVDDYFAAATQGKLGTKLEAGDSDRIHRSIYGGIVGGKPKRESGSSPDGRERTSETHRLNNVIATDTASKINDLLGRSLSVEKNGTVATGFTANDVIVAADPRRNTLIINAPPALMASVKKLVEDLDVPPHLRGHWEGRGDGKMFSITGSPALGVPANLPAALPPVSEGGPADVSAGANLNLQSDRMRTLGLQPAIPSTNGATYDAPTTLGRQSGGAGMAYDDISRKIAPLADLTSPARGFGFERGAENKPAEPVAAGRSGASSGAPSPPPVNKPAKAEYFNPPLVVAKRDAEAGKPADGLGRAGFGAQQSSPAKVGQSIIAGNEVTKEVTVQAVQDKQPAQPEPPPEAASRKIIRTGQMEFEVDSFDGAVAGVTKIVNNVKGGFVATVNSDKLPNGKVKGSVVVRMPPEKLDKFLLDVRQDLGKTGELKSQRIGSQDVTKQYTDVESRLRGARAMEERFIQIIKTGKGEIKDLIVAENALGVWRTKIEEMEGEIRYFNNQVGLSTLTITLVEKEIQAPASLVVTERVKMQLEVDDVEKARDTALTAVNEAKGRITKSELKQHAAGQLEAILHFEVAPAAAGKVKDRLKQLGYVTNQTADRSEQAQGASSAANIKLKQTDVKFEVAMYNVANIQPREVLSIQIACQDVAVSFKKLQEAAQKAKAQVRNGQLNEQDKNNVTAQFDVDVPTPEKKTLDQAVGDAGAVMSRTATQAGPGEAATDRKVGYRLVLRMAPTVTVTERQIIQLEVDDVDKALQAAKAAMTEAGGRVTKSELQQLPAGQLKVFLNFEIAPAAADKVRDDIRKLGIVTHQTSDRTQQGDAQAADGKIKQNDVKFEVTMYNTANIRPREELIIQIASLDVPGSFKKLQDAVLKANGQVRAGQLNEQDKVNVSAELNFDIPVSERKIVDQVLAEVGKVLSRTSSQAAPGEAATDRKVGYRMTIRNVATVAAREREQFAIEVKDVDQAVAAVADIVKSRQGRLSGAATNHLSNGQVTAILECDVPLAAKDELIRHLKEAGNVRVHKSARNPQVPDNELATAHFEIALATSGPIVPSDEGLLPQIRSGLYFGSKILAWSLVFVIIGCMAILPWVVVLWVVLKLIGRWRRKPAAGTV